MPRAGGKKILGSVQRSGAPLNPAYLEATQAKNAFELKQEMVTRTPSDPRVFATLLDLVPLAAKEKVGARDLQEMVDGVLANAAAYGPTFHADFGVRLVDALEAQLPGRGHRCGRRKSRNRSIRRGTAVCNFCRRSRRASRSWAGPRTPPS